MSGVDRNILRIAVFELLCRTDIPAKVTINEAIDIAKKFGTDDSGAFINGILDSIRIAMEEGKIDRLPGAPVFSGDDAPEDPVPTPGLRAEPIAAPHAAAGPVTDAPAPKTTDHYPGGSRREKWRLNKSC